MENFSENKRRRGRPRTVSDEALAVARWVGDRSMSTRHLHNIHYRTRALAVLTDDPSFAWLCDGVAMQEGGGISWKRTILNELGRIADLAAMRAVATELCQQRPKTREAIALIRRFRTGKSPQGNSVSLAMALEGTINSYLQSHPSTTWQQVRAALIGMLEAVKESEGMEWK